MKKYLCLLLAALLLTMSGCAPGNQEPAQTTLPAPEETWDMSDPPRLTVTCGDVSFVLNYAGCSWEGPAPNGQINAKIACGASPLDVRNPPKQFSVGAEDVELSFDVPPTSIVINMWEEMRMGNSMTEPVDVLKDVYTFSPHTGLRIYQVVATWEGGEYHGEASYHFRLIPGVMPIE